jgi:hypothetical protein
LFNEVGIPIEPFSLDNDIKTGVMNEHGILKRRTEDEEEGDEKDAWLESINES